jgi:hypothetical protein
VTFQSILALEQEAGLCSKAGRSVGVDDWIDALASQINSYNLSHATAPITVGEAWMMLKDRLIQDPSIVNTLPSGLSASGSLNEEQAVVALFQAGNALTGVSRNTSSASFDPAVFKSKLREACGVLVKSPQFLLRHVSPHGYSDNNMPDSPRLNVCLLGENSCGSYAQSCGYWRDVLRSMQQFVDCADRSVRPAPALSIPHLSPGDYVDLCPVDLCRFTPLNDHVFECVRDPSKCFDQLSLPPLCDPRIDECPWIDPFILGTQAAGPGITSPVDPCDLGVFVARFEGGEIVDPGRMRIRHVGAKKWTNIRGEEKLMAGDVIEIPLAGGVRLKVGRREIFLKPHRGIKSLKCVGGKPRASLFVSVTGPSAAKILDARALKGTLTFSQLRKGINTGRWESGVPRAVDLKRIQGYQRNPLLMPTTTDEEIAGLHNNLEQMHWPGWPKVPFPSDASRIQRQTRD